MLPSANISVMFAEVMSQPSLWPMTCGLTLATQVQPDLRKDCESFEVENSPSFTQVQITKINQCQTDPSAWCTPALLLSQSAAQNLQLHSPFQPVEQALDTLKTSVQSRNRSNRLGYYDHSSPQELQIDVNAELNAVHEPLTNCKFMHAKLGALGIGWPKTKKHNWRSNWKAKTVVYVFACLGLWIRLVPLQSSGKRKACKYLD